MAVFQITNGSCTGRGFSDVNPNGFCAKFYEWVTLSATSGGPEWEMLYDRSTNPTNVTISADYTTNIFTAVGHGFVTGEAVVISTDGTVPGGLSPGNTYFVSKIDDDNFYMCGVYAETYANPVEPINISNNGTGNLYALLNGPYIVVGQTTPADKNTVTKILKVFYITTDAGSMRVEGWLSWDDTNKIVKGNWFETLIHTVDAGDFAYDFRGGDECMALFSRISTTWQYTIIDEWEGITNFVESESIVATIQTPISAGTAVEIPLGSGEANLFTVSPETYYYIYDATDNFIVNYVGVSAKNVSADTITLSTLNNDFTSSGAIIGSYPHRFYVDATAGVGGTSFPKIPYYSHPNFGIYNVAGYSNASYNFHDQWGSNTSQCYFSILSNMDKPAPDDRGYYACMKPILTENRHNYTVNSTENMNRQYGKLKNIFASYGSMAQMLDYRVINSKDWLNYNSSVSPNYLILHTESTI